MNRLLGSGLVLAVLTAPAWSQSPADGDIESHILSSLMLDPRIGSSDVVAAVDNGFVTLSGSVSSLAARDFALKEVEKIAGVRGVTDKLDVDAPWRPDVDIAQDIRHRLLDHSRISASGIVVESDHGNVKLTGLVPAYVEKELATELASEVRGVRKVTNDMSVDYTRTRGDKDIAKDARIALDLDVYLCGLPVQVDVREGNVTLEGTVGSWYVRRRAEQDVRWVPGVMGVTNDLNVDWLENGGERAAPATVGDEALAQNVLHQLTHDTRIDATGLHVKATGGDVSVSGTVTSAYERNVALDDARNTLGVAWVNDFVQVRSSRREDQTVREDVLRQLRSDYLLWDSGLEVDVKDGVVTLEGRLPSTYQADHAMDVAFRVHGVRRVVNDVRVTPVLSDGSLTTAVASRLEWDWRTFPVSKAIKVAVDDRIVTLTGKVKHWSQRRAAERIAFETPGVLGVFNHLQVEGAPYAWDTWYGLPAPIGMVDIDR